MKSLVRKKDFKDLIHKGKRWKPTPWLVVNYSLNDFGCLRFGWTASAKIGTAVTRNRLKRWSREFFRREEDVGVDVNLLFLEVKNKAFYKELKHEELDKVLKNVFKKMREIQ